MAWAIEDPKMRLTYGRQLTTKSMEMNWWNKFMNNTESAIIMTDLKTEKPNGATVQVSFRGDIEGDGVFGNQDFDQNRGKQVELTQQIDYTLFGQSMKSKNQKIENKTVANNFRNKAHHDLPKWVAKRMDKIITAKLTEGCTNILACSSATGFYPVNNTSNIKAGDRLSVAAIREMKQRAKNGVDGNGVNHPEIEPAFSKSITREGGIADYVDYYVLVVGQYGASQLKSDPEWIEAQKLAANRGKDNPIFTGAMGEIDGVIVFERANWSDTKSGILTSNIKEFKIVSDGETLTIAKGFDDYAGENGHKTEISLFLGATAGLLAFEESYDYHEEDVDAKRKLVIGIDRGTGFASTRYEGKTDEEKASIYHKKDFGKGAIVYSAEM
ncbi:DUF4043 family protein [Aliarcobacter lanthieri]|uniref:phage capsid family protein n=1 Tax=Aliarcobacter lanthieri TaxID=1355374 RepID=UPI003AAF3EEB